MKETSSSKLPQSDPSTMASANRPKSSSSKGSNRLVYSIASGLKKGTKKIFKKNQIGRNNDGLPNGRRNSRRQRRQHYGTFRRRTRRNRGLKNDQDSESFSSPERKSILNPLSSTDTISRSMQAMNNQPSIDMPSGIGIVQGDDDIQSQVLRNFEYLMRRINTYVIVYLCGAYQSFSFLSTGLVLKFGICTLIMWVTCIIIKCMVYRALQKEKESRKEIVAEDFSFACSDYEEVGKPRSVEYDIRGVSHRLEEGLEEDQEEEEEEEEEQDEEQDDDEEELADEDGDVESQKLLLTSPEVRGEDKAQSPRDTLHEESLHSMVSLNEVEVSKRSWEQVTQITSLDPPQNHPDMEELFVINKLENERIYPNGKPIPVENEFISGNLVSMLRTKDADVKDPTPEMRGSSTNDSVSNYFRDKKRRFEIQLQFKFKKLPETQSPLFISSELDEPIKLSMIQRAFMKATMNFVKKKNPSFSYSIFDDIKFSEEDKRAGKYEKPRLSFPVETSLDRLVVTKPGEEPPALGGDIHEDPEAIAKRKKGIIYNTNDTYTFCFWCAYIDFLKWKACNLPAIRPFSIANVNGAQSACIKFYFLKSTSGRHFQCDMDLIADVELAHRKESLMGDGLNSWIDKRIQESNGSPIVKSAKNQTENIGIPKFKIDTRADSDSDDVSSDLDGGIDDEQTDLDLDEIDEGSEESETPKKDSTQYHPSSGDQNGIGLKHAHEHETFSQLPPSQVKNFKFDVPAWIEIMHGKKKKLQRVYAVRVVRNIESSLLQENNERVDAEFPSSFTRLRTGKQLSELAQLGIQLGIKMSKGGNMER